MHDLLRFPVLIDAAEQDVVKDMIAEYPELLIRMVSESAGRWAPPVHCCSQSSILPCTWALTACCNPLSVDGEF
jgi:hypothetical protein